MNKQKRTFVILAIVLAACLAGYLGLLNYNKYKSDDDSESESDSVEALSLDSSDVKSLSFLIDGQEYTFSRIKSDGTSDETESTESEKQTQNQSLLILMMTSSGSAIMIPLLNQYKQGHIIAWKRHKHHCFKEI